MVQNFGAGEFLDFPPKPHFFLSDDRTGSVRYCQRTHIHTYTTGSNNNSPHTDYTVSTNRIGTSAPVEVDTYDMATSSGGANILFGQLDLDPNPEAIMGYGGLSLFDVDSGDIDRVRSVSFPVGGSARVLADFTGDGVDDPVAFADTKFVVSLPGTQTLYRTIHEKGYMNGSLAYRGDTEQISTDSWPAKATPIVADVNGDGLNDLIAYLANGTSGDELKVFYSTGHGFTNATTYSIPNIATQNGSVNVTSDDLNDDGLDDLIVHEGYGQYPNTIPTTWVPSTPYVSKPAHVLLNTGSGFSRKQIEGSNSVDHYVGKGDFDGDGLTDFVIEGANGKIVWGDGGIPNRLVKVTDQRGGVTDISYRSSAQQSGQPGGNQIPVVQQLVDAITVKDGRGNQRTTTYTYANGKYDFINRKALGYDTVTATLEAVPGVGVPPYLPPVITTIYLNNNFVDAGLVKSRIVSTGGTTTWAKEVNDWDVTKGGTAVSFTANGAPESGGPFRVTKARERVASLYLDQLIETMKEFTWTEHGEVETVIDYGFSDQGADLAPGDNTVTTIEYAPNIADYIVDRPSSKYVSGRHRFLATAQRVAFRRILPLRWRGCERRDAVRGQSDRGLSLDR